LISCLAWQRVTDTARSPIPNSTTRALALWLPLRAASPMTAMRSKSGEQSDGSVDSSADRLPKLLAMRQKMKRPELR
jgi:hypothetical protein